MCVVSKADVNDPSRSAPLRYTLPLGVFFRFRYIKESLHVNITYEIVQEENISLKSIMSQDTTSSASQPATKWISDIDPVAFAERFFCRQAQSIYFSA